MTRTPASIASSTGAALVVVLLSGCASERGFRFDDIVSLPLTSQTNAGAFSAPAADGVARIRREEVLRRELAIGRDADEPRERCSINGGIEGC